MKNSKPISASLMLIMALVVSALGQTNVRHTHAIGFYQGMSFFSQGKYVVSNLAYDEYLKIDPLNTEARYNMGVIYDLQRNYMAAIAAYNKATMINPNYQKARSIKMPISIGSITKIPISAGDISERASLNN